MSFQYKIRGEQFVQFERQSQDYIEQRDQDLESSLSYDFSNLNADNLTSGTVPSARISGSYTGITQTGTLSALDVSGTFEVSPSVNHTLFVSSNRVGVRTNTPQGAFDVAGTAFATAFTAAGTVTANLFNGSGANLTSIPNSATTATSSNVVSTIVSRNASGNFTAGTINATLFDGSGANLTSIPNSATTATASNVVSTIVSRNASGNFTAGTVFATLFDGSGASLTSIPAGQLTGTVASARISGSYTGITGVGTLANGLTVSGGYVYINTSGQNYLCQSPTTGTGNAAHWVGVLGVYNLYRNTSTIREKENIQSVGNLLNPNMIDAINVQLWNRKTAPGIPEVGPMAEEMDAISPFLSTRGLDMNEDGEYIPAPVDGINSNSWLSLLTIGMQDIRQRLQQLETT